jgi:hypothetical protein
MEIRTQIQQSRVEDEFSAIVAVVRPILEGLLYALKQDVVAEVNGHQNVKLKMLPRLYRPGDRDCGICFEYAVHDALRRGEGRVTERVTHWGPAIFLVEMSPLFSSALKRPAHLI